MSGKFVTLLVLGIIASVLLSFSFQNQQKLRLRTRGSGTIFYQRRPPPYQSPRRDPVVLKEFRDFVFYGQEESDGRTWLKVFFSQPPEYFGLYWVARDELEFPREG